MRGRAIDAEEARYRMGASRLGIDPSEYRAKIEAGLRWCSFHKSWEPAETFVRRTDRSSGYDAQCVEASRSRSRENMRALRERRKAS